MIYTTRKDFYDPSFAYIFILLSEICLVGLWIFAIMKSDYSLYLNPYKYYILCSAIIYIIVFGVTGVFHPSLFVLEKNVYIIVIPSLILRMINIIWSLIIWCCFSQNNVGIEIVFYITFVYSIIVSILSIFISYPIIRYKIKEHNYYREKQRQIQDKEKKKQSEEEKKHKEEEEEKKEENKSIQDILQETKEKWRQEEYVRKTQELQRLKDEEKKYLDKIKMYQQEYYNNSVV
jgi:uncharacterized protein YacL